MRLQKKLNFLGFYLTDLLEMVQGPLAFFLLLIFILPTIGCQSALKIEKLSLPVVQEAELPNGLRLILIPNNHTRLVEFQVIVNAGLSAEPSGQEGVAKIVNDLLLKGNTQKNADELTQSLREVGATLQSEVSEHIARIRLTGLSYHRLRLLNDFIAIISQPSFKPEEVKKAVVRFQQNDTESSQDLEILSQVLFREQIYGQHYYSKVLPYSRNSRKALARKDIIKFYLENYRPNNSVIMITGNFDRDELKKMLEERLSDWTPRPVDRPDSFTWESLSLEKPVIQSLPNQKLIAIRWGGYSPRLGLSMSSEPEARLLETIWRQSVLHQLTLLKDQLKSEKLVADLSFRFLHGGGDFNWYLKGEPEAINQALEIIKSHSEELKKEGFDPNEFEKVKQKIELQNVLWLQNPFEFSDHIAKSVFMNNSFQKNISLWSRIRDCELKNVNSLLFHLLEDGRMTSAVIGAVK